MAWAGAVVACVTLLGQDPAAAATPAELVAGLEAAGTEEARTALLEAAPQLLTLALRKALSTRGAELQRGDEPARAFVLHQLAHRVATHLQDREGTAAALDGMADALYARGDFAAALRDYLESLRLHEQLADRAGMADVLIGIGRVHYRRGDYPAALAHLERSIALSEAIGGKAGVAQAWLDIGIVRYLQSDYPAALSSYETSLRLNEELGNKAALATALNNIGILHYWQGDYENALGHYRRGLELREALGTKSAIAYSLNNLAGVYHVMGDYRRARELYQRSLELHRGPRDPAVVNPLNNLGQLYELQGDFDLAAEHHRRALVIAEASGDRKGYADGLEGLGRALVDAGRHREAAGLYERALELSRRLGDKNGIADGLKGLGHVALSAGDHASALERYSASLRVSEELGLKRGVSQDLTSIATTQNLQGRHEDALRSAERAVVLAEEGGSRELLWRAHTEAGKAYRGLGRAPEARRALEEALAHVESLRSGAGGGAEEGRRFLEGKLAPYHALVGMLVAEGHAPDALGYAERAKARVLLDVLRSGRVNIRRNMTGAEQDLERTLTGNLVAAGRRVRQESARAAPDPARLAELGGRLERARLDYESFRSTLYAAHPELRVQRGDASPIDVEQAAELVHDRDSALIEYVVTDDRTYLFVLTRDATPLRVHVLEIGRKQLGERVSAFRERLGGRNLDVRRPAAALYELVLGPARKEIAGRKRLVIVPDDVLWSLPFQALQGGGGKYLLQDHAISYAPSFTALREMSARSRAGGPASLFAMGNPSRSLPQAEREVRALARLYGNGRSRVYVGRRASEDRAKAEAGGFRLLHFATHGILNEASPMYSQLVLSPPLGAENEDGLLEAWEILQLDLEADLAVLSACESGRGRAGGGEGLIGLSWAFFVAGCPTTVVSQWKVESASTTRLMLAFHRNLRAGASKAQALRQAALDLLRDPRHRHPFYWAGFVVVGDGS